MKIALNTLMLAALVLGAGCNMTKDQKPPLNDTFVPEGEVRRVQQVSRMQAAAGAMEDGILYAWHFDGNDLSPLGREKLDYLADADTVSQVSVYLDVKHETFDQRSKSVVAYLQDRGMASSHVKVVEGINESTLNPAADNVAHLPRTESLADTEGGTGTAAVAPMSSSR